MKERIDFKKALKICKMVKWEWPWADLLLLWINWWR